jgi:excisionase family DNA binding protein
LLNTDEAAHYLHVKPRFIKRLVAEKRVTVRKVGRFNRFTREDLDAVVRTIEPNEVPTPKTVTLPTDDPIVRAVRSVTRSRRGSTTTGTRTTTP